MHEERLRQRRRATIAIAACLTLFGGSGLHAQSLRGSSISLDRQNVAARDHDFTYLRTSGQVERFVSAGYLVRIRGNGDFQLHDVSFPYARTEVALFVSRLARQYRSACGEQLVVTSLTRPRSRQPNNASSRSVHPTGMAVDLRRSNRRSCRAWLEDTLLSLEAQGVLEATREQRPPHYHIAVFPQQYAAYVSGKVEAPPTRVAEASDDVQYRVRSGDSLWTIARRHGTTVERLRVANELNGSRIYAGQVLTLPAAR